jgi:outer membrane autotransporter protein
MAGEDPDGPFGDLLEQLVQEENPGKVIDTLGLLSPEQYPNLLDVSMAGFELYRSGVLGRMGNLHLTRGAQDLMYADNTNTLVAGDPAMSRLPAFQRTPGGWSGWARVLGMTGDQDSDNGKLGFNIDSYGLALGFDNQINDNLVLGIGGGYTNNDVDFDDLGQDTESDSYHVSLYGSYSNNAWYLDGAVLYATSDYDTDRLTPGTKATSSTDSTEWGIYVGGGYNLVDDTDWYFIPTASAQWAQVDIDGFTEKGAGPFNLKVDDYDTDSLVTALGFRIGANMVFGETRVEPEFRLSWAHEFGDTDRDVKAMFAMGGPSFTINGVEPDEDSALVGAGLNAHMTENFTVFVDYDGEFRSDFDAHMLSGGLRYNF